MKKIKPFSRYKYITLIELHNDKDQETYDLIKENFKEQGTEEIMRGVFLTNRENALVEIMVSFMKLKRYQGINKAIKTCKTLHVADMSDMTMLLEDNIS